MRFSFPFSVAGVSSVDWLLQQSLADIQRKASLSSTQAKQAVTAAINKHKLVHQTGKFLNFTRYFCLLLIAIFAK